MSRLPRSSGRPSAAARSTNRATATTTVVGAAAAPGRARRLPTVSADRQRCREHGPPCRRAACARRGRCPSRRATLLRLGVPLARASPAGASPRLLPGVRVRMLQGGGTHGCCWRRSPRLRQPRVLPQPPRAARHRATPAARPQRPGSTTHGPLACPVARPTPHAQPRHAAPPRCEPGSGG